MIALLIFEMNLVASLTYYLSLPSCCFRVCVCVRVRLKCEKVLKICEVNDFEILLSGLFDILDGQWTTYENSLRN